MFLSLQISDSLRLESESMNPSMIFTSWLSVQKGNQLNGFQSQGGNSTRMLSLGDVTFSEFYLQSAAIYKIYSIISSNNSVKVSLSHKNLNSNFLKFDSNLSWKSAFQGWNPTWKLHFVVLNETKTKSVKNIREWLSKITSWSYRCPQCI